MKSKIDYRVLTMDEIIFDNRNKTYGAFMVRQHYESNLRKAMLITASIFLISVSAPALLKGLGWLAEKPAVSLVKEIFDIASFPNVSPLSPQENPHVNKPVTSKPDKENEYQAVDKSKLPKDPVVKTPDPVVQPTLPVGPGAPGGNGSPVGSGPGGNPTGTTLPVKTTVYNPESVQQMPEFIGGQEAFQEFIDENIVYPEDEKIDEVQGITKVEFIVQDDGTVTNVRINRSSGNSNLDKEAVRLVKLLPRYKPGRHNGIPVKVLCILPIEFTIR